MLRLVSNRAPSQASNLVWAFIAAALIVASPVSAADYEGFRIKRTVDSSTLDEPRNTSLANIEIEVRVANGALTGAVSIKDKIINNLRCGPQTSEVEGRLQFEALGSYKNGGLHLALPTIELSGREFGQTVVDPIKMTCGAYSKPFKMQVSSQEAKPSEYWPRACPIGSHSTCR